MFLVIEGLDGAGKSTQVRLLQEALKERGIESEFLHFPRFDSPFYGELIARFLRGDFGGLDQVDPYLVATLYAGDRMNASAQIQSWLNQGKCVITDRYVYSNIAYQCAKIESEQERERLREWIFDLEYENNKIVVPDVSLFLDVPFKFTEKSLATQREGDDREYLKGKSDIHESSLDFQRKVRSIYLSQQEKDDRFKIVNCCSENGEMLPAEEIFFQISAFLPFNV
ncbi:MAG: dTMP kinase [Rikenellaceae bacterium]